MTKVIMISGANRGIGKAIALKLYEQGFIVSLGMRNPEAAEVNFLTLEKERLLLSHYNALDPDTEKDWIKSTLQQFGKIDGLINNAGIYRATDVEDDNEEELDTLFAINTKAPIRLARLALPHLRQSKEGRIINIVSDAAKYIRDSKVGYSISKSGFLAASHAMLHAVKKDGVRVTAICPSWVNTEMARHNVAMPPEKMIQPDSIAEIVLMLLRLPNTLVIPELIIDNV